MLPSDKINKREIDLQLHKDLEVRYKTTITTTNQKTVLTHTSVGFANGSNKHSW